MEAKAQAVQKYPTKAERVKSAIWNLREGIELDSNELNLLDSYIENLQRQSQKSHGYKKIIRHMQLSQTAIKMENRWLRELLFGDSEEITKAIINKGDNTLWGRFRNLINKESKG